MGYEFVSKGTLLFPLNFGKTMVHNISLQPGSPLPRVPRTRGFPPHHPAPHHPALGPGLRAQLQGNAAMLPIFSYSSEIDWKK